MRNNKAAVSAILFILLFVFPSVKQAAVEVGIEEQTEPLGNDFGMADAFAAAPGRFP